MRRLIVLPLLLATAGCNPFASSWTDDCEAAFKERLRAPSTYERIEASVFSTDLTLEEYTKRGHALSTLEKEKLSKNNSSIKEWNVLVTYEADNAMGVPLRDKFFCQEDTTTGKEPEGGRSDVMLSLMKVNGKSQHDLLIEALLESKK